MRHAAAAAAVTVRHAAAAAAVTDSFAAAAGRLAGVAGAVAGWRPDDFWNATPAELGAVLAAFAGPAAAAPATAADIGRLMEEHPDG